MYLQLLNNCDFAYDPKFTYMQKVQNVYSSFTVEKKVQFIMWFLLFTGWSQKMIHMHKRCC